MATITGTDNQTYLSVEGQANATRQEGSIENPSSVLGSQEFLKLFIETLKNQTIDSTTDIREIMDYTASMTTVETNNANKEALQNVVETLTNNSNYSSQYGLLPAIGKLAITNQSTVGYDGKNDVPFAMYFPKEVDTGEITIKNLGGATIRTISLDEYVNEVGVQGEDDRGVSLKGADGLLRFTWNGALEDGTKLGEGEYRMSVKYRDTDGGQHTLNLGEYKVESVKFKQGTPYLNIGDQDVKFEDILELRDIA